MDEKIRQWKKEYKEVYRVTINGEFYIFRTLNIGEVTKIQQLAINNNNEEVEHVLFGTVLMPEDFDPEAVPIAIGDKLLDHISKKSKVLAAEDVKAMYEASVQRLSEIDKSDFIQWKLSLMQVFPAYKLSDFDAMTPSEFFYLIALAEQLTGKALFNTEAVDNIISAQPPSQQASNIEERLQHDPTTGEIDANTGKFLSKNELELISADQSTRALRDHWIKHKKR